MADYFLQFTITFADTTIYSGTIEIIDRPNRARAVADAADDINAQLFRYGRGRGLAVGVSAIDAVRPARQAEP